MGDEVHHDGEGEAGEYAGASLYCDIVMKGGVTSGVVYPGAVKELAKRYKFRNIGGTSAGAIAAAVVAAAEHNRGRGGFEQLATLPPQLGSTQGGKPFMLQLFAPDGRTRPLFEAATGFMLYGKARAFLNLCRWFWTATVPPLAVLLASILVTALTGAPAIYAVVGALSTLVLLLLGAVTEGVRAVRALSENDFGICHLGPAAGSPGKPALTPWLHRQIQLAGGRTEDDPPLTFADLWGVDPLRPNASAERRRERDDDVALRSRDPEQRLIDLQMITTSLSHGRPIRLPVPVQKYDDALEEGADLLFDPEEMRRYFPDGVVAHLEAFGASPAPDTTAHLAREAPGRSFRHFPIGGDLPIVVAARMSLSLPVVIAAISLWELDKGVDRANPPLKRVVMSDGGVTSNFPIHLFDGPLPRRPTFGLQLTGFEKGDGPDPADPAHSIADPPPVTEQRREMRQEIDGLFGFLTAIKDAMQNWRDNTQSLLPGYRDRIVQLKMDRGEGGLNLAMPREKIDELTERGEVAGAHLVSLFSGPLGGTPVATDRWNDHRFARYRVTMSVLEGFLHSYREVYYTPDPVAAPWATRIAEGVDPPLEFAGQAELDAAILATNAYLDLALAAEAFSVDDANVPRPPATLRTVPRS